MQDDQARVVFPGGGPYAIPPAQYARATGGSNNVEMTLYCVIPEKGHEPLPIRVQMTYAVARALSDELLAAAIDAELASKKR